MVDHSLQVLGLFTLLVCFSCVTPWYTTNDYPTSRYPTREETTYWYPTTGYPDWTTRDDRYTTPPDWWETTTNDDRYTTPEEETTTGPSWDTTTADGTVSRARCPRGWTLYRDNCYIVVNGTKGYGEKWLEADQICRSLAPGGGLASIHDYSENNFLANLAQNQHHIVWTGLFYDQQVQPGQNPYKWQDGTYLDFIYWKSGYPKNDPNQGCVVMNTYNYYGQWEHKDCTYYSLKFFCKAPSTREYLDVDRDNYGCNPGFEGYGEYCYKFLPEMYFDRDTYSCRPYNEANHLFIESEDVNNFVVERMNNLSRHQSPAAMPLMGLFYVSLYGFYWNFYPFVPFTYHNFAVGDLVDPMAHSDPRMFMDLSNGEWFISDNPARPMGLVCKKKRFT